MKGKTPDRSRGPAAPYGLCPFHAGTYCIPACALFVRFPGLPDERAAVEAKIPVSGAGRCALVSIAENLSSLVTTTEYLADVTKQ